MHNERRQLLRSLGGVGAAAVGGAILLKPEPLEAHHLPPYIDVRDYATVQDALNVAGAGIAVFFPAGNYYLTAPLTVSNKAVTLLGAGVRVSNLIWTTASSGLEFSSAATVIAQPLTISGLSVLTTVAGAGTAITATWSGASPTALFSDFSIGGNDPTTQYWTSGIKLSNAKGGKISRFFIEGQTLTNVLDPAIRGDGNSTPLYISDGDIYSVHAGIVHVSSEGLHVSHCEIVDCNFGIVRYGLGIVGQACPGTSIDANHINARIYGIYTQTSGAVSIQGNAIWRFGGTAWTGVTIHESEFNRVVNNEFAAIDKISTTRYGIVVTVSKGNTVIGNIFQDMTISAWLGGSVTHTLASNNKSYNCATGVWDQFSVNHVFDNF